MSIDLASEAYQEIGYTEAKPDKGALRIPLCPRPNFHHESEEMTTNRMKKTLEAIFSVFPEARFEEGSSMIVVKTPKNKFEFFPVSDTYIHSGSKFGSDIPKLCTELKKKMTA